MFRQFGAQELLIILLIVVLLFGAKKLPDTARGLGRSLRIFKAETKGLTDDDSEESADKQATTPQVAPQATPQVAPQATPQVAPQATTQSVTEHQPVAAPDPAAHSDERP